MDGALGKNGISGGAVAGIRQPGNAKGNGGVAAAKISGPLGGVPDSAGQGADDAFDDSVGASVQPLAPKPTLLQQAVTRFDWVDLRGFAPHANAREAGQATSAITLSIWHSRQRFCPPVARRSGRRSPDGRSDAPTRRTATVCCSHAWSRAVITATRGRARPSAAATQRGMEGFELYSVSAGFVEAGENLEHACRREAMEETGIKLGEVRYLGSQPWPFPASLMMAFKAHAITTDVRVDGEETMTARWVTRDEYTAELIAGRMAAPGRATIARYMIEEWLGREL